MVGISGSSPTTLRRAKETKPSSGLLTNQQIFLLCFCAEQHHSESETECLLDGYLERVRPSAEQVPRDLGLVLWFDARRSTCLHSFGLLRDLSVSAKLAVELFP